MKQYDWDLEKNKQLIEERGVSFEEVIFHLTIIPSRKATRQYLGESNE